MKLKASWRRVLGAASAAAAVALSLLLPAGPAEAAAPAGSTIGNQASATYKDGAGQNQNTTSNLVQTLVQQVRSFTLTAPGTRTAAPGQTVYYPHVITNTGNGNDTYALQAVTTSGAFAHASPVYYADANGDGVPDNGVAITTTGSVAAGGQFRFVVAGQVPGSATLGQSGTMTVNVQDNNGTGTSLSNADVTTVAAAALTVTKSLSVGSGPSPNNGLLVTLSYINAGTAAASNVVITDTLPSGMTYASVDGGSGATEAAKWSGQALTNAAGGDAPAGIDFGVNTTTGVVTVSLTSVAAGSSGQITFRVNINSGLSPTNSALGTTCTTAGCEKLTTNFATYSVNGGATMTTNNVVYNVQQTGSVVLNGSASSAGPTAGEAIIVTSGAQGTVVSFPIYAWNTGNGTDTINISNVSANGGIGTFPPGTTFQVFRGDGTTPLIDTNSDGVVDTGPVAPSTTTPVALVVKATLPTSGTTGNNGGAGYTATFRATSVFGPATQWEEAPIRLDSIAANTVDLTINAALPTGAANGFGTTGTTVVANGIHSVTPQQSLSTTTVYPVYVNNTGGAPDSYNLALANALPTGWSLVFRADGGSTCGTLGASLTSTGTIAAGNNRLVCAVVTVPSIQSGNAGPGANPLHLQAQSASTAASSDLVAVQVTVATVHAVSLTPNGIQQTYAGSSVTYIHTLANIGNVPEPVSFASGFLANSRAGWTASAYLDANSNGALDIGTDPLLADTDPAINLAVGATRTIIVRVFAPGSAAASDPANITTLTGTYQTNVTVSATDTTSITEGLLLEKWQVLTACGTSGTPATPNAANYSKNPIAAGAGTAPGQCISYQIKATNTMATPITAVNVKDPVPVNTKLWTGCGAPTVTAGTATLSGPSTDNATGTILADGGTMAPTTSFTFTFCVKIDE